MAFRRLQEKLVFVPILVFPEFTKTFVLDTNVSNESIGAFLSQVEDGQETVIAYASRVLSKAERGYCVTRRELLAVVTFPQQFRVYLLGRHFVVQTDHGSLAWLTNFRNQERQLARWLKQLEEFDFDIAHRAGRKHLNADTLSRIPCQQCGHGSHATVPKRTLQYHSPTSKRQLWNQLRVKDGLLWQVYKSMDGTTTTLKLIVFGKYRQQIVQELHSGALDGHLGADKMHGSVKEHFHWPGYWNEVRLHCETCTSCSTRKTSAPKRQAPLQPIQSGYPLEIVAMDLAGPLPESPKRNHYILVIGDYFTKWMEACAIPDRKATTVAQKLVDRFFCRFSVPEQLHSD